MARVHNMQSGNEKIVHDFSKKNLWEEITKEHYMYTEEKGQQNEY